MYPAKPGFIVGFHGCDKTLRNSIVKGKALLKISNNLYDWLGNGIYFWENNQQRALEFAKDLQKNPRGSTIIKKPAVLGAVIDMGFCLDLLDTAYLQLVSESHRTLTESFKILGLPVPENKRVGNSGDFLLRFLDCAVIENLHLQRKKKSFPAFDSVRAVFTEGRPLYDGAGFNEKNHIQLCILNPNCIKGYFIPRAADNNFEMP